MDMALEEKIRELGYVLRVNGDDGAMDSHAREKQVALLAEDILRLIQGRNRALLNQKKARSASNGEAS